MKRLLLMLLSLLLLTLPAVAESTVPSGSEELYLEATTLDLGDFTMNVFTIDGIQTGVKADAQVLAVVYPLYNPEAVFHDTINIMWFAADQTANIALSGAEFFAQANLIDIVNAFTSSGIAATNPQLLSFAHENNEFAMAYSVNLDYTGVGRDLQMDIWQLQHYTMTPGNGTYVFTLTADSVDDLELLTYYLNTVVFKTAEAE